MLDYVYVSWGDLIAHIRDIRHFLNNEKHSLPDNSRQYTFSRIREMYEERTVINAAGNGFDVLIFCKVI